MMLLSQKSTLSVNEPNDRRNDGAGGLGVVALSLHEVDEVSILEEGPANASTTEK